MFIRRYILLLAIALPLFAGVKNLTLNNAIQMLKNDNLELKISRFNEQMKAYEIKAVEGLNYGKLDLTMTGMRSNDAGNVFGFKLQSREATFMDFGFADGVDVTTPPPSLNMPEARNHFQTKISYMLPLYTGGKLTEYQNITESMHRMSQLDTKKLLNAKIYQTKKAFYDISLVENYISNLSKIIKNIDRLEAIVKSMETEGYAQNIDRLEVQARSAEAQSMYNQAKLNKELAYQRSAEAQSMYNQAKLNKELAYQFLSFLLNKEVSTIKHKRDMAPMPPVNKRALEANNIDIQKALLGLEISDMAVEAQKGNFRPELGAFGEYGSADDVFLNEFFDKDAYTVGVQMKWNLFNGGVDEANLEKAKVQRMMVRDQVELAKKGIALKAKKLKTEVLSANADIRSYKKQLRFARKVYENYSARYKEGIVSISDVLIQQSKELEVLLKLLTAKNKRNTKIFELDSILNRGGKV
jgi:outer membrane protein TolC